jgi:thiamine-phosphate pyrophosphorylase
MTAILPRPVTMLVTDRRRFGRDHRDAVSAVVDQVERAAAAGIDLVQIREREIDDRLLVALVERVLAAVAPTAARVLVSERVDVALAAGAHGVHLPADGLSARDARRLLPDGALVGRSVHSEREVRAAAQAGGCDYLVFGTVFPSRSKPDGHLVAGLEGLAAACRATELPVLAIGGVTVERADAIAAAGAAGVAAIDLFAGVAPDADLARVIARLKDACRAHA